VYVFTMYVFTMFRNRNGGCSWANNGIDCGGIYIFTL